MNNQHRERLALLLQYLESEQIDLAIVISPKSVFYYTGFYSDPHERFMALVLDLRNQHHYLFVPALDLEAAEAVSSVKKIIPIFDEQNPYQVLKNKIGEGVETIGLETKNFNLYQQEEFNLFFPGFLYKDIGQFIAVQRMRKTPDECAMVQEAVYVIEKVLTEGINRVQVGMKELELTAELEYLMRRYGAEGPSFSTIVLSGEKSSLPHGHPDHKKINRGDFLLIDMGVILNGYCSDITRTFVVGESTGEQKRIYDIVRESVHAGINAVKAGNTAGSVDIAARDVIKANGYGQYFNNRVGHGLGMEVHEEPSIHEKNKLELEPGFLFTIEPGIYIPGYGGVRIEENVFIEETGNVKVLTSFPTEFTVLDL
ncbi:Xaa-Pro peptidase family protein [uncultured Metabacillus sp.]|uniref:M24 family metallopeptidase n=1 Tax=uncultured Metabacillus sp. TaxID=2860135 RepID=UPI002604C8FF|nr:Xaa-Pro peptidase family protein [uncultured Metabacillus sp.]